MGIFQYRDSDGELLRGKLLGDIYLTSSTALTLLLTALLRGKTGNVFDLFGPLDLYVLLVWMLLPFASPLLYARMAKGGQRRLRLWISLAVCCTWILVLLPNT